VLLSYFSKHYNLSCFEGHSKTTSFLLPNLTFQGIYLLLWSKITLSNQSQIPAEKRSWKKDMIKDKSIGEVIFEMVCFPMKAELTCTIKSTLTDMAANAS